MKSIQKKNIILLGTWIFQAFSKFGKPQFVVWMIHLISNTGAFLSDVYLLDSGILMYQKGNCSFGFNLSMAKRCLVVGWKGNSFLPVV